MDEAIRRKRKHSWDVDELNNIATSQQSLDENLNEAESVQQHQNQPQRIQNRRQSERLLEKKQKLETNKENTSPSKKTKKRGRPRKNGKKHKQLASTPPGSVAVPPLPLATSSSAAIPANTEFTVQNIEVDFGLKAKCKLTEGILKVFNDFQKDPKISTRYSAKCTLCDDAADRKFFLRGNNTNLKSHLKRVSKLYFCSSCFTFFC